MANKFLGMSFKSLLSFSIAFSLCLLSLIFLFGCGSNPTDSGNGHHAPSVYKLTITTTPEGKGTVEATPAGWSYINGTTVEMSASALDAGYVFGSWEGDVSGETTPINITMNSNKNVKAVFRTVTLNTYTLTMAVSPDVSVGSVALNPSGGSYPDGTKVTLTASASVGYVFDGWAGDLSGSTNPVTVEVNGDKGITAVFIKTWHAVGNIGFSDGAVIALSLHVYNGTPYVAYRDLANNDKMTVKRFDGANWEAVGDLGFSSEIPYYISLFVSSEGTPYVAYKGCTNYKATVMKYDGANWVNVGAPNFPVTSEVTSISNHISLYISSNGTPYVVFGVNSPYFSSPRLSVNKYDGANWVTVGTTEYSAGAPSIYIYNDTPYVFGGEVLLKYNGSSWEAFFGLGDRTAANGKSLSVYNGNSYVAYTYAGPAYVSKYNGSNWTTVGNGSCSDWGDADYLDLFVYDDVPYVAYRDYSKSLKATVMTFNGSAWVPVGQKGISSGEAQNISLYMYNGTPYVAYSDLGNGHKATVMKYGP